MSAPPPTTARRAPALAAGLIELRLMATPRRLLVLCVLTALAAVLGLAIQLPGVVPIPPAGVDEWPRRFVFDAFLLAVLPLSALYIGTVLWNDEVESGTLVYLITRPVARPAILLAKFTAAWIVVTGVLAVGLIGTAVTLGTLRGTGAGGLGACLTVLPMASAAWLALATWVGTQLPRPLLFGLLGGALSELFLAQFDGIAREFTPGFHVGSAVAGFASYAAVPTEHLVSGEPVAPWVAWTVLLAIAVGALTLACLRVRYKEYAPTRSD